jgi:hypothetical protein
MNCIGLKKPLIRTLFVMNERVGGRLISDAGFLLLSAVEHRLPDRHCQPRV